MVNDPLADIATRTRPSAPNFGTPQSKRSKNVAIPGAPGTKQKKNAAGGYTFRIDPVSQLRRFLTLGVDGPTYYTSAKTLAEENAKVVFEFAEGRVTLADGETAEPISSHKVLVDLLTEISVQGRAPKQNPAIFALAVASSNGTDAERRYALEQLPKVCRTATHLFLFLGYVQNFRGWGPQLAKYVGQWYTGTPGEPRDADNLAYQLVKYRSREGWTHRDVLRQAHPRTDNAQVRALFDWTCKRTPEVELPRIVQGFERAQAKDAPFPELVSEYRLPWEALPDEALSDPKVWRALLDSKALPLTALLRQLPRLSRLDLLTAGKQGNQLSVVVDRLTDAEYLHKSRIHPINVLVALRTYASGVSARGESTWTPSQPIVDALDKAFYAAFKNVEPTGKRVRYALDVSGSMGSPVSGLPLSCREATGALALISASVESEYDMVGFTAGAGRSYWSREAALTPLAISPRQRLDDVLRTISGLPFGATDCSLPVTDALDKNLQFDAMVVYTDNETWAGNIHPHEALQKYRARTGIDAKLVVVAMTATGSSIADPSDAGMLDISGMDSTVPNVISDFIRG
jgi:60 kDa SS-A/Ro ribonucleoprotein